MAERDEDLSLLGRWRDGDRRAGNTLLRRHFAVVTRFFERRVDTDTLPELVQSTFLASVKTRDQVPDGVRFKAYLLGIARKQLLMHIRTRSRKPATDPFVQEPIASSSIGPTRVVAARAEARLLLAAMRTLDEPMQAIVELFYWDDLTTREISEVLDIPVGTIKVRLSQARQLLRERILEMGVAPELADRSISCLDGQPARGSGD
jgi:RNA polymerase sigma-70 factor (ECF subfamily)